MRRPGFIAALLLAGALVSSSCREDTALAQVPYRRTGRTMRFAPIAGSGFATNTLSLFLESAGAEYAEAADADELECDGENAFTLVAGVYQDAATINQTIATKWAYATQGTWGLQSGASCTATHCNLQAFVATALNDAGTYCATTGNVLAEDTWNVVAEVYDGSQVTAANRVALHVNTVGALTKSCSGTIPATLTNGTAAMRIGTWSGTLSARYWQGNLDEFYFWCEALDNTELACAMAAVAAGTDAYTCATTTPRVALRMGDGDTLPTILNRGAAGDFTIVSGDGNEFEASVP